MKNSQNSYSENDEKVVTDLLIRKKGPFFGFCIKGGIYKPLGIFVTKIDKDGVADKAGLRVDDEILSVNKKDFTSLKIQEALEFLLHLKSAQVKVRRRDATNNRQYNISLVKIQIARSSLFETFGFTVKSLIEDNVFKKLMVTSVIDGSPAQKSRLEVGDEILEVNDRPLITADDFYQTIQIFRNALVLVLMVRKSEHSSSMNSSYESNNQNNNNSSPDEFQSSPIEAVNRTQSSSSHRLESIISQLSDNDDDDVEDGVDEYLDRQRRTSRSSSPPVTYQRKYQIPKNSTQFESKYRPSKKVKQHLPTKTTTTNNYDNNPIVVERSLSKRSSSIQNMLNAFKMVTLENSSDNDDENHFDDVWSDDDDDDDDGDFERELERRAQNWQVPFVPSTILTTHNERSFDPKARLNNFRKAETVNPLDQRKNDEPIEKINKPKIKAKKGIQADEKNSIQNRKTDEEKLESKLGAEEETATPYNLLPCSSEIWLPAEDSLLNIESEMIIPETALSSQVVLDYEYKMATSDKDRQPQNSIRFGTYKSKTSSTPRSELKPNGVVLIRVMRTADSNERFGLKMWKKSDGEFCVDAVDSASEAHRLGLFQIGQVILRVNQTDLRDLSTSEECEEFIENVYKNESQLEMEISIKLKK